MARTTSLILLTLLAAACLDADGRSAPSSTDPATGDDGSDLAAQVEALSAELDAFSAQMEAETAALREELDAQETAVAALSDALASIDGGAAGLADLSARLDAVEARGQVETATGSGSGTCASLTMDVVAGRPVVVVATVRGTGNNGWWNNPPLYGYGGTVSASVSASGAASGSASLSAAGYTATFAGFETSGWTGSDTRAFSVLPTSDGEVVVSMSSSVSDAYGGYLRDPTVDSCTLTAIQL